MLMYLYQISQLDSLVFPQKALNGKIYKVAISKLLAVIVTLWELECIKYKESVKIQVT